MDLECALSPGAGLWRGDLQDEEGEIVSAVKTESFVLQLDPVSDLTTEERGRIFAGGGDECFCPIVPVSYLPLELLQSVRESLTIQYPNIIWHSLRPLRLLCLNLHALLRRHSSPRRGLHGCWVQGQQRSVLRETSSRYYRRWETRRSE